MTTSTRHAWSGRPLTRLALTATLAGTGAAGLAAAELHTETIAAWTRYVDATEQRIAAELDGDSMRVYLKLRRKKFVTVYYGTEHVMDYARHGAVKASSRSVATRIAELVDVGSAGEREKPIGNDRGFLWRLNSYWRYHELDGGVIVECESISLSRSIPSVVRWMVTPMINSAARESMARTLTSMRARLVPQAAEPLHAARD